MEAYASMAQLVEKVRLTPAIYAKLSKSGENRHDFPHFWPPAGG